MTYSSQELDFVLALSSFSHGELSHGDARAVSACGAGAGRTCVWGGVRVFETAKANAQPSSPLIGWRVLTEGGAAQV